MLILAPISAGIVLLAGDYTLPTENNSHLPIIAGMVMLGAYLLSSLISLPGLLMNKREQMSEELHVGEHGMKLVQTLPGADGPRQATSWQILWSDVTTAKLRYRDVDAPYVGATIYTRDGDQQDLYARDWQLAQGSPRAGAVLPSLPKSRAAALHSSDLVKTLTREGLKFDDDVPRPQDRLATWLGLSLSAIALIAALILSYVAEH